MMDETIDTTSKPLPVQDTSVLELQIARWDRAVAGHRRWTEDTGMLRQNYGARTCIKFLEGDQWDEADLLKLNDEGRAAITINKIARLFRLVVGYQAQNRFEPEVKPTDDVLSDYYMADIRSHLMKNDLDRNLYGHVESQVFQDGMGSGRGFAEVKLDYSKNIRGDTIIKAKDPFRIYIDSDASEYDSSSWGFCFESSWMGLEDILLAFGYDAYLQSKSLPNATGSQVMRSSMDTGDDPTPKSTFGLDAWFNRSTESNTTLNGNILIAEHFDKAQKLIRVLSGQHRSLKRVKYFLEPVGGDLIEIRDEWDAQTIAGIVQYAAEKGLQLQVVTRVERRVRWIVTAGDVILHNDWSPYDDITIVPYFPYFRRGVTRGMVHDLIDPQKEVNKRRSAIIHVVTTTANSGWMVPRNSLTAEELEKLETEGASSGYVMIYDPVPGTQLKPEKIQPAVSAAALERMEQQASNDLKEVSGINESSLGEQDNAQSGVAVENRQRQTVVGLQMYLDNLALTRQLIGERMLAIQSRYYTQPRIVRMLGLDGKSNDTMVNELGLAGETINDLGIGRYRLQVNSVNAADTFMQRQFNELMDMVKTGIIPPAVAGPMAVELSNVPNKPQFMQMLNAALQMQLAPPAAPGAGAPGGSAPPPGK